MNKAQNTPTEPKKLIEVALPIKEVSLESVRDKSIRHGHISTLHLWWARRPLPVCRAVVFASLVPDPLDEHCPLQFKEVVQTLLGSANNPLDPYKPYTNMPFTAIEDAMEDNLRNRLLMFIGKFSDVFLRNEKEGKLTSAKDTLSDSSLIKWDNKNNKEILQKARKLVWVAHDPVHNTLDAFDSFFKAIEHAEDALHEIPNRHISYSLVKEKEAALEKAIKSFQDRMPAVFDPFAGGGAIPLEAVRLGCRAYANDINPVAHIIEKGTLQFPQKYGKPIIYSKEEFIKRYGEAEFISLGREHKLPFSGKVTHVRLKNRLAFDVGYYAKELLRKTEEEIGHLYPADENGNKPVAYYWARVGTCANPDCKAQVPLLRDFYLVNKSKKKIYINPIIRGKTIEFEIKEGKHNLEGWMNRANLKCPCCGNITDVKILKKQFLDKRTTERLVAVIYENINGKEYRLPTKRDFTSIQNVSNLYPRQIESMDNGNARDLKLPNWGFTLWIEMFSNRQLYVIQTLIYQLNEIKELLKLKMDDYVKAVLTYLGILIDRITPRMTSFGIWDTTRETLAHIFGRQAIPMIFDYPESNPFCSSSGSAINQIEWILRYIESESSYPFSVECKNSTSGDISQFPEKSIDAVVTDPPYYDAIAYADLSDFFYVWLKRTLYDIYPEIFIYPQTPKSDECTALKHHHKGNKKDADIHFENKLLKIFSAIEKQTSGIVSIMFAHQSTQAWTTLCNSILNANMNITASWANDTEMTTALKTDKAFLESSVTVVCRPSSHRLGYGDYQEVKEAIRQKIRQEVKILYNIGFRGADLLTACFGQAAGEFGKYERVEKADGSIVEVSELLNMARDSAFNAIVSDIETDDITRFYIGWLNLFQFSEAQHDDVRRIVQIGLNIDTNQLLTETILIRDKNRETLATFTQRLLAHPKLGEPTEAYMIDKIHKAMSLFRGEHKDLVRFIAEKAGARENPFWRVLHSLVEVLPHGTEDYKAGSGLLGIRDSLIREAKQKEKELPELIQRKLGF